jgi:hypothetical protein
MNTQNNFIEMLLNKSDEELVRLFSNENNLKYELDNYSYKKNDITKDELCKLMIEEYRNSLHQLIDDDINHKQYTWSVLLQRIKKKFFN